MQRCNLGFTATLGLAVVACAALEARSAGTWDRTSQTSRVESYALADAAGSSGEDEDDQSTGWVSTDYARKSASATDTDSLQGGGTYTVDAETHGSCELNADNQSILRWEWAHDEADDDPALHTAKTTLSGSSYGGASASMEQTIETDVEAELDHPTATANTKGKIYVYISWEDTGTSWLATVSRNVDMEICYGDAMLLLYPESGTGKLKAEGKINGQTVFTKTSSTALSSASGSLEVELTDLEVTLADEDVATIKTNTNSPVSTNMGFSGSFWNPGTVSKSSKFEGEIEIHVVN